MGMFSLNFINANATHYFMKKFKKEYICFWNADFFKQRKGFLSFF